ncbi:hypothetical protein [Paenibacillus sp. 79R4]|uniref:hypothetical protein n=1 Tax=Paenibacillus sp. 79R4 TaxID=2212847 RepID=UPI0015B82F5A|nr:hypothetical protein [Paenibacillus sp. 79R4]
MEETVIKTIGRLCDLITKRADMIGNSENMNTSEELIALAEVVNATSDLVKSLKV